MIHDATASWINKKAGKKQTQEQSPGIFWRYLTCFHMELLEII